MRLIGKQMKIDEISFIPELEVVLRIPLERATDGQAIDPNFYENIGKRFMKALEQDVN